MRELISQNLIEFWILVGLFIIFIGFKYFKSLSILFLFIVIIILSFVFWIQNYCGESLSLIDRFRCAIIF